VSRAGERERRHSGAALRVPFVRRCVLTVENGPPRTAFTVNLNARGVYVADGEMPRLGDRVVCRLRLPGNEIEVEAKGVVAWVNPNQLHRVHSLPPGFGVKFETLPAEITAAFEEIVREYLARNPGSRG